LAHRFFQEDEDTYSDAVRLHCSRCVQSGYATQSTDVAILSQSLQLANAINAQAFRESLLNKVLPSIHHNVDAWRVRQRGLLIDHVVSIITDPDQELSAETISGATHVLDERVHKWVDEKREAIQNYARSRIVNEACENTIDLWAAEAVIHRIDARCHKLEVQTDQTFNAAGIENRKCNRLAELEALADEQIAAEEVRLNEMVAQCLGELNHEAKVKVFEAENEASSRSLISAICTSKATKPSPISSCTRSKGKPNKRKRILDLNSQPSTELDTPMSDYAPSKLSSPPPSQPVLLPAADIVSPSDPTPKAISFPASGPPLPPPRPKSTMPKGLPHLTPTPEPASELMMVLAALDSMKCSLSAEIHKVNAHIDHLILNPPGIVPSSQPFEDFGDFTFPSQETNDDAPAVPTFTMPDEEICLEGLYFDLAKILHSSGRCSSFSDEDHELFADFLSCFLWELKWDLIPHSYTADQLDHVAQLWNARNAEIEASSKHFHDLNLFDDLFGTSAPRSSDDLTRFSQVIDEFCAHYKKSRPLPDSDYVFIKEFHSCPSTASNYKNTGHSTKARVHFFEPPITSINQPDTCPLKPLSDIPIPDPADFPALSGKPFGDTWCYDP
jgi:hypothetical protein